MGEQKFDKLEELCGVDLAGWKITICYMLAKTHNLMGFFPVITVANEEPVAVLDKILLKMVWDKVGGGMEAYIAEFAVVANAELGIAFNLNPRNGIKFGVNSVNGDMQPFRLLSAGDIDTLCGTEDPFMWRPGLLGAANRRARPPDFT